MTSEPYKIVLTALAKKDLRIIAKSEYKAKVEKIFKALVKDPYSSPPLYEKLVGSNKFSCKINQKHRIVYEVNEVEKTITFFSCWTHYHDN